MRLVKAAFAAVVLAVLLAAPPLLLVGYVGNPWPDEGVALDTPLTDNAIIGLLAVLVWVFWAQLVVCVVVETVAAVRNIDMPVHLPGTLGLQQDLARRLVTTIVAVGVATVATASSWTDSASAATTPPTASHLTGQTAVIQPNPDQTGPVHADTQDDTHRAGPVIEVRRGDTLWAIAQHHLGDPTRWKEIAALNAGHTQPDGRVFHDADLLRPGWQLQLPADASGVDTPNFSPAPHTNTVKAGDTLWQIAQDELGDPNAYPRIAAANQDLVQDPDVIDIGWQLTVPRARADRESPQGAAGRFDGARHDTPDGARRDDIGESRPPAVPRIDPMVPDRVDANADSGDAAGNRGTLEVALGGAGAILAAGVFALLIRRRREQFRRRRSGRSIATTPAELVGTERVVVTRGPVGAFDVELLDRALRMLAATSAARDQPLPEVAAARVSADRIELVVDPGRLSPPQPWIADDATGRWYLDRASLAATGENLYVVAPYPSLAVVGSDDAGAHWLLDLEHAGVVRVEGNQARATDFLRAIAAELAVNAWSERIEVTMAGFGVEMLRLDSQRLRHTSDLDEAAGVLRSDLTRRQEVSARFDTDVLTARRDELAVDSWDPRVLLVAADVERADAVADLGADIAEAAGRSTVVLVAGGPVAAGHGSALVVDEAGRLSIAGLVDGLTARQLSADAAADIAALVDHPSTAPDMPMPPATGDHAHEALADAAGGLRVELTVPRDDSPAHGSATMLPLADDQYLDRAATTAADLAALAPRVSASVRADVLAADPDLDRDLADWCDPDSGIARLTVLGPVVLRAHGKVPDRVAYHAEVVAYLASREHGVTTELLADVFAIAKSTAHSRVGAVRAWLGTNPRTGRLYLPDAKQSKTAVAGGVPVYALDGLLVDADLFRRLRLRGQGRGPDGIADLEAALQLVSGRPFDHRRPGGYGWLAETPLDHYLTAAIVDVAHIVTTHHLAAGDTARARSAVEVALSGAPDEDKPRVDMVEVMRAEGRDDDADTYLRCHIANRADGGEAPMDLSERTVEVLARRGPRTTRPRPHGRRVG